MQQGTTVGGISERLGDIFSNQAFRPLIEERQRAIQGQLSAGGLTRSGTALEEIAGVPTEVGFGIEGLIQNRLSNLAGGGLGAVNQAGQFGANAAGNIANLQAGIGTQKAGGFLLDAANQAQGIRNLREEFVSAKNDALGLFGGVAGGAAGGAAAGGGGAGGGAAMFFSDPKLKENVNKIGMISNLNIYAWDWIEQTKGTIIEKCGTIGFMADEVLLAYPHHVHEYCGFKVINYPGLMDELEEIN